MLELRNPEAPMTPLAPAAWTRKDLLDTDTLSAEELRLIMETAEGTAPGPVPMAWQAPSKVVGRPRRFSRT